VRVVLAENLLAAMLGLEVASGNDALASHSAIRKTAKLMPQFIAGTDFICSGYSAVPRQDNLFGGGNFDASVCFATIKPLPSAWPTSRHLTGM